MLIFSTFVPIQKHILIVGHVEGRWDLRHDINLYRISKTSFLASAFAPHVSDLIIDLATELDCVVKEQRKKDSTFYIVPTQQQKKRNIQPILIERVSIRLHRLRLHRLIHSIAFTRRWCCIGLCDHCFMPTAIEALKLSDFIGENVFYSLFLQN